MMRTFCKCGAVGYTQQGGNGSGGLFATDYTTVKSLANANPNALVELRNKTSGDVICAQRCETRRGFSPNTLATSVQFKNVTPSQWGLITAGSGLVWTLQAGHNMPASGQLHVHRPLQTSAQNCDGGTAPFTVSGNTLTLGAAPVGPVWGAGLGIGIGDQVIVEGVSEFEVYVDWSPGRNVIGYFAGSGGGEEGYIMQSHASATQNNLWSSFATCRQAGVQGGVYVDCGQPPSFGGECKMIDFTPALGEGCGVGFQSNGHQTINTNTAAGSAYDTAWRDAVFYGSGQAYGGVAVSPNPDSIADTSGYLYKNVDTAEVVVGMWGDKDLGLTRYATASPAGNLNSHRVSGVATTLSRDSGQVKAQFTRAWLELNHPEVGTP